MLARGNLRVQSLERPYTALVDRTVMPETRFSFAIVAGQGWIFFVLMACTLYTLVLSMLLAFYM